MHCKAHHHPLAPSLLCPYAVALPLLRRADYKTRRYTPWGAYGQSKLANVLFAKEVAERNAASGVRALSVHPGVIKTPLWRNIPGASSIGGFLVSTFLADKNVQQGAATSVFACLAPECGREDYAGSYLSDCAIAVPNADARNPELRKALWEITEQQLKAAGFPAPAERVAAKTK